MDSKGLRLPLPSEQGRATCIEFAELADERGIDTVWVPETWARNSVVLMTQLAERLEHATLASGITNIYSRTPGLVAMTAAALVDVDVRLPAVEDPDPLDAVEVADLVLRRRDDVPGPDRAAGAVAAVLDLDDEPSAVVRLGAVIALADRRHARRPAVEPVGARGRGLLGEEVEQAPGVHAEREAGEVLQVRVPAQERPAVVDHERVEPLPGREHGRGEPGDAAAADDHVAGAARVGLVVPGRLVTAHRSSLRSSRESSLSIAISVGAREPP